VPASKRPSISITAASVLILLILAALACDSWTAVGDASTQLPPAGGGQQDTPAPADWFSLYFSDPTGPGARSLRGGPDAHLAQALEGARLSVDVAAYDLDLWSLRDALIAAQRRGVRVRMVTESDNLQTDEIQQLKEAGIEVLGDRREGLMHNKFMVIDRLEVWTGSMNFTVNGAYRNDNNLLRIRSSRLAEDYIAEFEEMFVEDRFGPGSPANTPNPALTIEGTPLEIFFSPDDETLSHLVEQVENARQSIYFLAFSFTSDPLADALIESWQAGVQVAGVLEEAQVETNFGGDYDRLRQTGVDVRLDGNLDSMHHKVLIIDERIVVTGSYNFSNSAETRNDENTLIIHNAQLAAAYLAEFQRIYNQSK